MGSAQAVEGYYQALAEKDKDRLINLSCVDWEQSALMELDSLTGVGSELNEIKCQETSIEGENSLVTCSGELALDYNGELQSLALDGRTIVVRIEDGEWRVCGYK